MAKNVSRNRNDYPESTHRHTAAMAKVFYDGDIDAAWEAFFDAVEEMPEPSPPEKDPYRKRGSLQLRLPRN